MFTGQEISSLSRFDAVQAATDIEREPPKTATRSVKVTQPHGLHLRPCMAIVSAVGQHQANVMIRKGSQSVDAASILELLTLAAAPGTELVLSATGVDSQEALEAVARLFAHDS